MESEVFFLQKLFTQKQIKFKIPIKVKLCIKLALVNSKINLIQQNKSKNDIASICKLVTK